MLSACIAIAQSDARAQDTERVEDDPDFFHTGPYFQAGVVQAWSQFTAPGVPDVPNNVGGDFALGARIKPYFATELDFEFIPNWQIKGLDTSTHAIMVNAKGYFPIRRFQPFILAGGGMLISQEATDYKIRYGYRFGVGVDVFVVNSIYLSLSYRYTGNLDDFGYTNLLWGVGYQFE